MKHKNSLTHDKILLTQNLLYVSTNPTINKSGLWAYIEKEHYSKRTMYFKRQNYALNLESSDSYFRYNSYKLVSSSKF